MPGPVEKTSSPAGTVETKRHFQPSLRDSFAMPSDPGVQTPGYFQNVPAGHSNTPFQSRAVSVGLENAVKEMLRLMKNHRG